PLPAELDDLSRPEAVAHRSHAAADPIAALEDLHRHAGLGEPVGAGESRQARADDRDRCRIAAPARASEDRCNRSCAAAGERGLRADIEQLTAGERARQDSVRFADCARAPLPQLARHFLRLRHHSITPGSTEITMIARITRWKFFFTVSRPPNW